VEGQLVHAAVNRSELQQVLTNLITNAIHAMPDGGRVTVSVREQRACSPEDRQGNSQPYVVVRVSDNGTGIAPDVLPKIFDRSSRQGTLDKARGSGCRLRTES